MKKIVIATALLAICLFSLSASSPQQKPQWEYKIAFQCDEKKANSIAAEGWELVNIGYASFNGVGATACAFKRPKN